MLISNLELEKKALNLRLWEANISKIELTAEVTRQASSQETRDQSETVSGKESVMARVGILESSVSLNRYFCSSDSINKEKTVYVVSLAKDMDFEVQSEVLK